ncbi:MAG: S1/P1 nuclease [Pseudomonadota bacterium]
MKRLLALALGTVTLLAPQTAAAWGDGGHMLVAAIAWEQMTPAARRNAGLLLRSNAAQFAKWTAGVASKDKDQVAFIAAATWPDAIKCEKNCTYAKDRYDPDSEIPRRNMGWSDFNQHRYWHFKDIPFSTDGTATEPPPEVNAQERMELFIATIGDGAATRSLRAYDLTWFLHLAGDVHQPLHATSRFTRGAGGDGGGNEVTVCVPVQTRCTSQTLHSFWDRAFATQEPLAIAGMAHTMVANAAGDGLPTRNSPAAQILAPGSWIEESFGLAKAHVYTGPIGPGLGKFRLTLDYQRDAVKLLRQQVMVAGGRVANVLNKALG